MCHLAPTGRSPSPAECDLDDSHGIVLMLDKATAGECFDVLASVKFGGYVQDKVLDRILGGLPWAPGEAPRVILTNFSTDHFPYSTGSWEDSHGHLVRHPVLS